MKYTSTLLTLITVISLVKGEQPSVPFYDHLLVTENNAKLNEEFVLSFSVKALMDLPETEVLFEIPYGIELVDGMPYQIINPNYNDSIGISIKLRITYPGPYKIVAHTIFAPAETISIFQHFVEELYIICTEDTAIYSYNGADGITYNLVTDQTIGEVPPIQPPLTQHLDQEEIGYILFHTKKEDEIPLVIEKIKNFRSLPPEKRTSEINAYKNTEEGKLTLVKAPTAGYYMYLCYSTGLCNRVFVKVNKTKGNRLSAIELRNKEEARKILKMFENVEIYDFKDNWFLWKEYFSNPKRMYPPFDIIVRANVKEEILVAVHKESYSAGSDVISQARPSFELPVFQGENYHFIAYALESGDKIYDNTVKFTRQNDEFVIDVREREHVGKITKEKLVEQIQEMFTGRYAGFDKDYYTKLKTLEKVLGKNYFDNRRKGGRLEYLFYELLGLLKSEGIIDDVFWFGNQGKYGICEPAPGGKEGNPDVVFEMDDYSFVLELTTFRGNRAQWSSAEASSVPDHIAKFKKTNPGKKVVGIFSAPSIHHQLEQNLILNAQNEKVGMIFKPCIEFTDFLSKTNRGDLKSKLIQESKTQIAG